MHKKSIVKFYLEETLVSPSKISSISDEYDTAVWGINETCQVTVEIPFEQKYAIFDYICP